MSWVEAALLPQPNSFIQNDLKNAAGCKPLNGAKPNHVAQTCACKHAAVAHSAEERGTWQFETHVLVLNRSFANPDGDDIADHHHKSNLG